MWSWFHLLFWKIDGFLQFQITPTFAHHKYFHLSFTLPDSPTNTCCQKCCSVMWGSINNIANLLMKNFQTSFTHLHVNNIWLTLSTIFPQKVHYNWSSSTTIFLLSKLSIVGNLFMKTLHKKKFTLGGIFSCQISLKISTFSLSSL